MDAIPDSSRYNLTVLASLLPGLRDIRTPLAAGYLWVVVLWLLLHDYVPKSATEAQGAVGSLYQLGSLVGGSAGLAAVSFIAYLLGLILAIFTERLGTLIKAKISREHAPSPDARKQSQLGRFVDTALFDFEQDYPRFTVYDYVDVFGQMPGRTVHREEKSRDEVRQTFLEFVIDEYPAIAIRLQAKNRDLWDTYDRHTAEAEFRLGIAPPLVLASVTLAFQASPWWLCLLVVPAALVWLAWREFKQANLTLTQAITLKIVEPPALERLREIAVLKERGPRRPPGSSTDAHDALKPQGVPEVQKSAPGGGTSLTYP
jgi:hypothetical protein